MLLHVAGLLVAGTAESQGMLEFGSVGPGIERFGYGALLLNILIGIFSEESSDWLSKQMFQFDVFGYLFSAKRRVRVRARTRTHTHTLTPHMGSIRVI